MFSKCPGQDMRGITVSLHKCPQCGETVEMFSDELKRRCPKCKTEVRKDRIPSCIEWCRFAKKCLGEERFKELMREKL